MAASGRVCSSAASRLMVASNVAGGIIHRVHHALPRQGKPILATHAVLHSRRYWSTISSHPTTTVKKNHALFPYPNRHTPRSLGVGHVRFRQLRLYHGGHYRHLQCLFRLGRGRQPAMGDIRMDGCAVGLLCRNHVHSPAHWCLCGCVCRQEEASCADHHRLRGIYRAVSTGRAGQPVASHSADRAFQFLLRQRRKPDRGLPAGTGARAFAREGLGMGMEPGLCRRTGEPGRLPRLCILGAGAGSAGCGLRAGNHADHRRAVRTFQPADVSVPERTRSAAAASAGA